MSLPLVSDMFGFSSQQLRNPAALLEDLPLLVGEELSLRSHRPGHRSAESCLAVVRSLRQETSSLDMPLNMWSTPKLASEWPTQPTQATVLAQWVKHELPEQLRTITLTTMQRRSFTVSHRIATTWWTWIWIQKTWCEPLVVRICGLWFRNSRNYPLNYAVWFAWSWAPGLLLYHGLQQIWHVTPGGRPARWKPGSCMYNIL